MSYSLAIIASHVQAICKTEITWNIAMKSEILCLMKNLYVLFK